MSRAYEAMLAERLARFERLIAESEALALRSSDEETLRQVAADVSRWRESQASCDHVLRRTKSINCVVRGALIGFSAGFVLLCFGAVFQPEGLLLGALIFSTLLLLCGSAVVYISALLVRDIVAHGRRMWHFRLSSLFAVMTVIAVLLGLLVYSWRS